MGNALMDAHADRFRAREHDAVHARVPPQRLARDLPGAGDVIEHPACQSRVAVHFVQLEPRPRRFLSWLVDDGIPRHQRGRRHPGGQGQREIERSDTGKHAVGPQDVGVPLDRSHLRHLAHEAVRVLELLAVIVDQIGRLLGVAHRLEPALADLQAHDRCQLELALPDEGRRLAEQGDPLAPRPPRPIALRVACRRYRPAYLLRGRRREPAKHHVRVDRRGVDDRWPTRWDRLAADVHGIVAAELGPCACQRGVELTVKLLPVDVG